MFFYEMLSYFIYLTIDIINDFLCNVDIFYLFNDWYNQCFLCNAVIFYLFNDW